MKRAMTWMTALAVVFAGFAVMSENQASAGLFNRNKCKPAKCKKVRHSTCCQPVSCCPAPCEQAAPCGCQSAAPCGCQSAAPCGCESAAAPCGCEAAAAPCGCEATAACGCETKCQTCSRRQIRKAKRHGCCIQQCSACSSCSSCESSSPCGCGESSAAPAEGAEMAPDLPEDAST